MSMAASESVGNADDGGASFALSRAPSDGEADSDTVGTAGTGSSEPGVSHAMQVCLPHYADAQQRLLTTEHLSDLMRTSRANHFL